MFGEDGCHAAFGSEEVSSDFGSADAGMKQTEPNSAAGIIAVLACLLISLSVDASNSASVPAVARPAVIESWPAGTRLRIPDRVMESYRKESDSWSYPSVYLFANHFRTGPSLRDERKSTFYVPLVREQTAEAEQKEVLMDIMNIRRVAGSHSVFVTDCEIHVIVIPAGEIAILASERYTYVGAGVDK